MGKLTTHVLDLVHGGPAAGMRVTLSRRAGDGSLTLVKQLDLNADGRADAPLLEGQGLQRGRYRLVFAVGTYFASRGVVLPEPPFLDEVPIDFAVASPDEHYHVPLLTSPWAYSTYRGS